MDRGVRTGIGLGVLVAAAQVARLSDPEAVLDDAYISFRTARNLVEHGSLTFDVTRPPVEGMTNLLWTLLSAIPVALLPAVDPLLPARLLGSVLFLAAVALLGAWVGRATATAGGNAGRAAAAAALALAASGNLAFYAGSGLETGLWILLAVAAGERADAALRGGRGGWLVGGLLGALAATRPEGVLLGGLACAGLALLPGGRLVALRAAVPFALAVAALEAFRWVTYGALVPNTFHAKPPDPTAGIAYAGAFLAGGLGCVGLLGPLPALRHPGARLVAALAAVEIAGAAWSGGDWMPGYRRCALAFVAIAGLTGFGIGIGGGSTLPGRWLRRPGTAFAVVGLTGILAGQGVLAATGRDRLHCDLRPWAALGERLAATPGVDRVALFDIGAFGWHFPGSVFDLGGLTDATIAARAGTHAEKAWDEGYFRQQAPDAVIVGSATDPAEVGMAGLRVRGPDRDVLRSILAHGGYAPWTTLRVEDGMFLLVFGREGGPPRPDDAPYTPAAAP